MEATTRRAVAGVVVAAVVGLGVVLAIQYARAPYATRVGTRDEAPDFRLKGLVAGEGQVLAERAPATLLVLFDTRWENAGPYVVSVERLYRRYVRHGLRVVGVCLDEDPAPARTFAERFGATFPVFHDPGGRTIAPLYGTPRGLETYVIGRDRRVAFVVRGVVSWQRDEHRSRIEALLPSPPPGVW